MALPDETRDRVLVLQVAADALSKLCESAAANANSGNVQTDPMMKNLRAQHLMVQNIGNEFLTIDRPNQAGSRKYGVHIKTFFAGRLTAVPAITQAQHDAVVLLFDDNVSYSKQQWASRMFEAGISTDEVALSLWDNISSAEPT
jgi:acetaldehyde dehydrogenase (acetylating)